MKSQWNTKAIRIHPLWIVNVCTEFHGSQTRLFQSSPNSKLNKQVIVSLVAKKGISLTVIFKRKLAEVFTWFIILGGAEEERSLGALQTHLSPVCDGLQLHGVAAVLLQPLQIHPTLCLRQHKTLVCQHFFDTILSLFQSPVIVLLIISS